MVTGYLDQICSGVANYCEIYRENIFGESVSWSCPCQVPTLMSKVSCNQRVFIAINPGRIPLHMQSTCRKYVYVLVCATYVPSISQMHTVVLPGKMQVHQCIQEGYIQDGQERGKARFFFFRFVLCHLSPKGSHICIHTLYVFFLLPFPWRPS